MGASGNPEPVVGPGDLTWRWAAAARFGWDAHCPVDHTPGPSLCHQFTCNVPRPPLNAAGGRRKQVLRPSGRMEINVGQVFPGAGTACAELLRPLSLVHIRQCCSGSRRHLGTEHGGRQGPEPESQGVNLGPLKKTAESAHTKSTPSPLRTHKNDGLEQDCLEEH